MKKLIYLIIFLFSLGSFAQGGPKVDVIKFRGEVTNTVRDTFDVPVGETWIIWNESYNRLEVAQSNDIWKILLTEDVFSWPNVWTGSSNTFEKQLVVGDEGGLQGQIDLIGNSATNLSYILFNNNDFDTQLGHLGYNDGDGVRIINQISSKTFRVKDDGLLDYNGQMTLQDDPYDATDWNGNLEVPTKNAVRDEMILKGGLASNQSWSGSNFFSDVMFPNYTYHGQLDGVNDRRWLEGKSNGTVNGDFIFARQDATTTNTGGSYTTLYKLNASGTPTDDTDLTDKAYVDSVIGGGGTDDQTAAEVSVDASGFDGNLDTGDTDVQAALQKLDDLNINLGGGIVAEGVETMPSGSGNRTITVTHSLGYSPASSRIQLQSVNITTIPSLTINNITSTTFDIISNTPEGNFIAWRIFGTDSETPLDFGEVASGLDTELGSSDWRTGGSVTDGDKGDITVSGATWTVDSGAITSTKILDGTITNADISASAGIALTKLGTTTPSSPVITNISGTLQATTPSNFREMIGYVIPSDITGRTSATRITNAYEQTQAGYTTDGAPASGTLVIIPDAPPAEVVSTATISMTDFKMYNDSSIDAATITLSDCDPGDRLTVYINRASAPTLSGTGLTFNQLPGTTAFASATDMAISFMVTDNGTTVDYFYYER